MIVFLLNLSQTCVFASPQIVAEKKAGDFHYNIKADGETLTWSIGDGKKQSELKEDKNNQRELDQFREAVNEMSVQKFSLIIYILYLLFIGMIGYILYKKVAKKKEGTHGDRCTVRYICCIQVLYGLRIFCTILSGMPNIILQLLHKAKKSTAGSKTRAVLFLFRNLI